MAENDKPKEATEQLDEEYEDFVGSFDKGRDLDPITQEMAFWDYMDELARRETTVREEVLAEGLAPDELNDFFDHLNRQKLEFMRTATKEQIEAILEAAQTKIDMSEAQALDGSDDSGNAGSHWTVMSLEDFLTMTDPPNPALEPNKAKDRDKDDIPF